jgi:hypothetical protein
MKLIALPWTLRVLTGFPGSKPTLTDSMGSFIITSPGTEAEGESVIFLVTYRLRSVRITRR